MRLAAIITLLSLTGSVSAQFPFRSPANCGPTYCAPVRSAYVAPAPVVQAVENVIASQIIIAPIPVATYTVGQQYAGFQSPQIGYQTAPAQVVQQTPVQQPVVQQQAVQQQAGPDYSAENQRLRQENAELRARQNPAPAPALVQPTPPTPTPQAQPTPMADPPKQETTSFRGATPATQKNCSSCHDKGVAASSGKGIILFDGQTFIASDLLKLKSVHQVLKGSMPKGRKLADEDVGKLIQEIIGESN